MIKRIEGGKWKLIAEFYPHNLLPLNCVLRPLKNKRGPEQRKGKRAQRSDTFRMIIFVSFQELAPV